MADSLLSDITPVASVTGSMELYVNVPGTPDTDGKATVDQVVDYAAGSFVPSTRSVSTSTGLDGGGDLSANITIGLGSAAVTSLGLADTAVQPGDLGNSAALDVGTTAGTVAAGNDSRFTDARTPTAHASTHVSGGTDIIRNATAAQDGLMTAAYAFKLDNIEAGADVTAAAIAAASTKATPVDADSIPLVDSEASNALKRITLTVLKAFINALTNPMTTAGDLIIGGISGAVTRLAYVADGKILGGVSGAPAWVDPPSGGGGGQLLGYVVSTTEASSTANVPIDGTIPQDSEMTAYPSLDVTVTPSNATHIIEVDVELFVAAGSTAAGVVGAIFQDSGTDALTARMSVLPLSYTNVLRFRYMAVAGSGARTYKVYFGTGGAASTTYINRNQAAADLWSTSLTSSITVKEYPAP